MDSPTSAAGSTEERTIRVVAQHVRERAQKCQTAYPLKRPLSLLELPVDILQLIVREITHTNDLTALALVNSALYNLAIPHIYSRFDIVWPDGPIGTTESKSVDALTYGLSTLCLGSTFARTLSNNFHPNTPRLSKLVDNDYAKYTRKFSLGNGPSNWVADYAVYKESGKMLGTLVASAITRMKNLETFVWDMPTGVLSRVFEALASLAHQPDSGCNLSRVWVRWHDSSQHPGESGVLNPNDTVNGTALVPQGSQLTPVGIMLPPNASHPPPRRPVRYSEYHCEYPTFSVLPPLKSLAVLDIDEIGYLDEMAVLIERSKHTLQELRVGISAKAANQAFAQTWDGSDLLQIDHQARWPGESTIGDRRLGGVLGVLVGKIYDIRKRRPQDQFAIPALADESSLPMVSQAPIALQDPVNESSESQQPDGIDAPLQPDTSAEARGMFKGLESTKASAVDRKRREGKLRLHTLELERVVLSLQVCRYAIDWSVLTNLTLLDCAQHDNLWKMLRKHFQPTPVSAALGTGSKPAPVNAPLQYHLTLKAIHTDTTTMSLINLIKETLAPNTLEVLFLQDRKRSTGPRPSLDIIFKFAIRRHAASLRKLLLDSSAKPTGDTIRWRQWALTTEVLLYVTSGRMKNLRELAVSMQYKDWHTFLQRLPNFPQLRSLHIPYLADHPAGGSCDPRDLALSIVDIVALRPEIRLCYVGIGAKCFEILESREDMTKVGSAMKGEVGGDAAGGSGMSMPAAPAVGVLNGVGGGGVEAGLDGAEPEYDVDSDSSSEAESGEEGEEEGAQNAGGGDELDAEEAGSEEGGVNGNETWDNTPTTATSDSDETQSEDEDGDGDVEDDAAGAGVTAAGSGAAVGGGVNTGAEGEDEDDGDGFVELGCGRVKMNLREILFYDDKVAIFKARHGKL
ncbi:hypothetical protein N657DRAFT_191171 [Parathielavia appendiculata]|uniref:F-box domain-containing protein n=1 Tax=Parathielavia appendiculata TaxID=2587402 RepID=A0AAN6U8R3_9PEZI|nr:hypothetical protein N657DRAFT_191171 [Parathielavia appendiculata]